MAKIVAFANLKGGSGKSTLAVLGSRFLRARGYSVLTVDADVQNSTTTWFEDDEDALEGKNLALALVTSDLKGNIHKSRNGDLVPSGLKLAGMGGLAISAVKELFEEAEYDWIVIDTAPTLDNLSVGAVQAADCVVAPFDASYFAMKTTKFWMDEVKKRAAHNPERLIMPVRNMWFSRAARDTSNTRDYEEVVDELVPERSNVAIPRTNIVKRILDREEIMSPSKEKAFLHGGLVELFCDVENQAMGTRVDWALSKIRF